MDLLAAVESPAMKMVGAAAGVGPGSEARSASGTRAKRTKVRERKRTNMGEEDWLGKEWLAQ